MLPPELQRNSSVLVMNQYLEAVPYLSSRYLSTDEQSDVAMGCVLLEFSAGETIQIENSVKDLGRGVFVLKADIAFVFTNRKGNLAERFSLKTGIRTGVGCTC